MATQKGDERENAMLLLCSNNSHPKGMPKGGENERRQASDATALLTAVWSPRACSIHKIKKQCCRDAPRTLYIATDFKTALTRLTYSTEF